IHWAKGQGRDHDAKPGGSPNLIWHGGDIMSNVQTTAIFWGPSWGNVNFTGDKITGLRTFYDGIGNSTYAQTSDEYTDAMGSVTSVITNNLDVIDLSAAPSGGNRTALILAEVCKVTSNNPVPNGYYAVYVDTPRGHAGFCAWHSAGSCAGIPVQFAFFFNLDGDPGSAPQDTSGQDSQALSAVA